MINFESSSTLVIRFLAREHSWADLTEAELLGLLRGALNLGGEQTGGLYLRTLGRLYRHASNRLPQASRAALVRPRSEVSAAFYLPAMLWDADSQVVMSATLSCLHAASSSRKTHDETITCLIAHLLARDARNNGALLAGIMLHSDLEQLKALAPLRNHLSEACIAEAARLVAGTGSIPLFTFWLDWASKLVASASVADRRKFAHVMQALRRTGKLRVDGRMYSFVLEANPVDGRINARTTKQMDCLSFAQRIEAPLRHIERQETPAVSAPPVLLTWGLVPERDPATMHPAQSSCP